MCMKFIITTIVIYGVVHNGPNTDVMYSTIYPVLIDLRKAVLMEVGICWICHVFIFTLVTYNRMVILIYRLKR